MSTIINLVNSAANIISFIQLIVASIALIVSLNIKKTINQVKDFSDLAHNKHQIIGELNAYISLAKENKLSKKNISDLTHYLIDLGSKYPSLEARNKNEFRLLNKELLKNRDDTNTFKMHKHLAKLVNYIEREAH